MLLLKIWISYAIPDIPSWVATEMAKIEWRRREGEKTLHGFPFSNVSSLDTVDKSVQTEDQIGSDLSKMDQNGSNLITLDFSPGRLSTSPDYSNTRLRQKVTSLWDFLSFIYSLLFASIVINKAQFYFNLCCENAYARTYFQFISLSYPPKGKLCFFFISVSRLST